MGSIGNITPTSKEWYGVHIELCL